MDWKPERILSILDRCCESYTFPMLDNGYIYLAATRLSLYRSGLDWALVIEVFGFSPRSGTPNTHIYTFASRLYNRDKPERYRNRQDYEDYLLFQPHNESRFIDPIEDDGEEWIDPEDREFVLDNGQFVLRGEKYNLPTPEDYRTCKIQLEESKVQTFEFCRFLAATARNKVLATEQERRISVLPEMKQILQLEEWNHPDLINGKLASNSETFQQLAKVLSTGDTKYYNPTQPSNTNWINWLGGGRL
ncbi:conserved hypothetical protein [Hyella patelloides LEGE 07179]|uniref:Uncharacterized protein n=1 Tax=Hyella patelloides LEGE 07179 TaxID=945734 RepID=A0A563VLQ9_9CYAN|nr:hypothetical protein [Hyella patelloides]VEP12386.1 conserved hypothetical protein [Hyella patelloides LEGE 07179]